MTRARLLRLPCHLFAGCVAIASGLIGPPTAFYLIKILILFAACCWAVDLLFGRTTWVHLFYLAGALVLAAPAAVLLRIPMLPGYLVIWATILSGDLMMLSRKTNGEHLHVRYDYRYLTVELLGLGMRRLVAVGLTLKLPRMIASTMLLLLFALAALLGYQAFVAHLR